MGYAFLFLVVFAESGLLVGFFLPGDSLLFTVGVVSGAGKLPVVPMIVMLAAASILGDGSGFLLGGTLGYSLFKRNPKIFRREYLDRTHEFYERHGGKTIIYAKFVPIIRTFAAFIAGVGKMHYSRFFTFNRRWRGGLGHINDHAGLPAGECRCHQTQLREGCPGNYFRFFDSRCSSDSKKPR